MVSLWLCEVIGSQGGASRYVGEGGHQDEDFHVSSPECFFCNPDIAKTALLTEASSPAQALSPQYFGSALRHGVQNTILSPGEAFSAPAGTWEGLEGQGLLEGAFSPVVSCLVLPGADTPQAWRGPTSPRLPLTQGWHRGLGLLGLLREDRC